MNSNAEIFFSYAWGDESEQGDSRESIVNELYSSLKKDGYNVIRDKPDLGYKGIISDFMSRIGRGSSIIVALSPKYVKSPYCMFELYEIGRNSKFDKYEFREKVIPIQVRFVNFTDPLIIDEYLTHWEAEYNKWNDLLKKRAGLLTIEQMQRFDKIKMVYQNFGKLMDWIVDMNTLTIKILSENNFSEIKKAIETNTKQSSPLVAIHILHDFIEQPYWADAVPVQFTITNLLQDPLKLTRLVLQITERKEIDKVAFKKAGAPLTEFQLTASIGEENEIELLFDLKVQFILNGETSDAFNLALNGAEGYIFTCKLNAGFENLKTGESLNFESRSFMVQYPIRSLKVLQTRKIEL